MTSVKRQTVLAAAAAAAMGLATWSQAATVNIGFTLTDTDGNELTPVAGIYQVTQGTTFMVVPTGNVSGGYTTDTGRSGTTMDNKALGIQTVVFDINATNGNVTPRVDAGKWANYSGQTGVDFPFVNVLNSGGLNYLAGAGLSNTTLSLSTAAVLPLYQIGALGDAWLSQGDYLASTLGIVTLSSQITSANVFRDPTTGGVNDLIAEAATFGNGSIQVNVVPEPLTLGVMGLGVGILGLRRRRH